MDEQLLLTGATGYLGRHIVREWLRHTNATLHLLVRGKRELSADQRLRESLLAVLDPAEIERNRARLRLWRGDVTLPHLGLETGEYLALTKLATHVIHAAAAARFDLPLDQARATNVAGVNNMLALARATTQLRRFDHIGTAYVAGLRSGLILEHELDCGQDHRNTYERSKFEAELVLRDAMKSLPVMVARPSMILCDSRTGASSQYAGFARALQAYSSGRLTMLPGTEDGLLDFVPVDYVVTALLRLWRRNDTTGRTYHLAAGPAATLSLADLRELAAKSFARAPFVILPPTQFRAVAEPSSRSLPPESAKLLSELQLYAPYLSCRTIFDCTGTCRDTQLLAPRLDAYFDRFANWIGNRPPAMR